MKRAAATPEGAHEKVSATLDRNVLRMIRERTPNVSAFLNEAARRKLYFDMLDETIAELERQGVRRDEKLYQALGRWTDEWDRKQKRRRAASGHAR